MPLTSPSHLSCHAIHSLHFNLVEHLLIAANKWVALGISACFLPESQVCFSTHNRHMHNKTLRINLTSFIANPAVDGDVAVQGKTPLLVYSAIFTNVMVFVAKTIGMLWLLQQWHCVMYRANTKV